MNILFITKDLPYPLDGGAKIRIHAMMKNLAARNEIHLLSFDRSSNGSRAIDYLQEFCAGIVTVQPSESQLPRNKRRYQLLSLMSNAPYQYTSHFSHAMQKAIDLYLRQHKFDVVTVAHSQMGYYKLPSYESCVLSEHNVEYEILHRTFKHQTLSLRKLYNLVEWRKFKRDEINICSRFPLCLTTSARDKQILSKDLPHVRFAVVPNGVDLESYRGSTEQTQDDVILFTGTIDYFPNVDAIDHFVQEILPLVWKKRGNAKFLIVGKNPPPRISSYGKDPRIVVTGYVDDVRSYFNKAKVVVAPLRVGGGTRHKILEAMAMSKPVVSTSQGAEGLDVEHGSNILIADDPQQFSQGIISLLGDNELRARIAASGRRLVEEKYGWGAITRGLEEHYRSLLNLRSTKA